MKNIYRLLIVFVVSHLLISIVQAQAPQFINYQAIARNAAGSVLQNQQVTVRLTIHNNTPNGAIAYIETDTVTTNQFGLFTIEIGGATTIPGGFSGIAWGSGNKYLEVELDPLAGSNFANMGTTQLLSVPYALYAETSADNSWLKDGNNIYNANTGNIGIGTSAPAVSAALDVSSTTKGFLPPRLSTTERDAIAGTVAGLMVYNTTLNVPQYFDGTYWHNMNCTHFVGEHYGGGIVAYIDATGEHGYIVTDYDLASNATWGCYGTTMNTPISGVGYGLSNTNTIVTNCGGNGYAAELCQSLVHNGYSDWYLPTTDELSLIYNNNWAIGMGQNSYWSSTEYNQYTAYYVHFSNGAVLCCPGFGKNQQCYVRAVRNF